MKTIVRWLELLGGSTPFAVRTPGRAVALGLWWVTLLLLTLMFVGRATKFVYVDF
jgi:hypothetical protein